MLGVRRMGSRLLVAMLLPLLSLRCPLAVTAASGCPGGCPLVVAAA